MASGSLHAAMFNSYSTDYSYSGTISHGGGNIPSNSTSGTGDGYYAFTIDNGPDGLTYQVGGESSVMDLDELGFISLSFDHQIENGMFYPTTFDISIATTFELSTAANATIFFVSPMFEGAFSGTPTILLDGNAVSTTGSSFTLDAGSHTFTFLAQGGSTGADTSLTTFIANANFEAIPEPGTWALLVGGAGLLALARRKRAA